LKVHRYLAASGPVVAGYIFDTTNSYNLAFIICAVMATTGAVLAMLLRPVVDREIAK